MDQVINLYGPSKHKEGPGVWWTLRILAETRNQCFPEVVKVVLNNFFCEECKEHGSKFLRENPIPRDANNWFDWMVKWQNDVNRRTGKYTITSEQARIAMNANKPQPKQAKGIYWGQMGTNVNVVPCSDCTVVRNDEEVKKTSYRPTTYWQ